MFLKQRNIDLLKNKKLYIIVFVLFSLVFILQLIQFSPKKENRVFKNIPKKESISKVKSVDTSKIILQIPITDLEIPILKPDSYIINHFAYSLCYNEESEQAEWVAYLLTRNETRSIYKRSDRFIEDPMVKTRSADHSDYSKSGFDRGHLAPAGDMGWSSQSMEESFYYSNMSPQDPSFNRGIWKKMEEMVRAWALEYDSLYIVTGPVLNSGLQSIGQNGVAVPKFYYKIILDNSGKDKKALAFLVPNKGSKESISSFVVNIDKVEEITGIDFFPLLPDNIEKSLEANVNENQWIWKVQRTDQVNDKLNTNQSSDEKNVISVQCSGTTKKGKRCKNKTLNSSGRCHQHD